MDERDVERIGDVKEQTRWIAVDQPGYSSKVHRVGELLPGGFDMYLRLFHPFVPWDQAVADPAAAKELRTWRSLAGDAGVCFHAELTWRSLEPILPLHDDARPYAVSGEGEIEPKTRSRLFQALASAADGDAFFLYGLAAVVRGGEQLLYRAPVSAIESVCARAERDVDGHVAGPERVWPVDRSWMIVTDYDLVSTYLGTGDALASRLLANEALELLPVERTTRIDDGADLVNGTGHAPSNPGS